MTTKDYSFNAPPAMAIAVGATTPNPGFVGATVWSTTALQTLVWTGTKWAVPTLNDDDNEIQSTYTGNFAGTSHIAARADHLHKHGDYPLGNGGHHSTATQAIAGFMSPVDKAKLDGISAGAGSGAALSSTSPASVGTTNTVGVGTTAARADHVHAHGTQTDGTMHAAATTSIAGFLSAADKTKLDGVATGATVGPTLSSTAPAAVAAAAAVGVGTTAARADHVHAHGTQTDGTMHAAATTSIAGFLSAADKTKLDGVATGATVGPTLSSTAPAAVAAAAAVGVGTTAARADHVHAHGTQTDPTMHADVTTTADGFMIAADKVKLNTLGSGTTTSAGAADVGKVPLLNASGKVDATCLPATTLGTVDSINFNDLATPANANTAGGLLYVQNIAGKRFASLAEPNSSIAARALGTALFQQRCGLWQAGVGTHAPTMFGTTYTFSGAVSNLVAADITARANAAQAFHRHRYTTTVTGFANAGVNIQPALPISSLPGFGGIFCALRFSLPVVYAGMAWAVGWQGTSMTSGYVDNIVNFMGFGARAGDTNVSFFVNGNPVATYNNRTDLGANFPAKTAGVCYEARIYRAANSNKISYSLRRLDAVVPPAEGVVTLTLAAMPSLAGNCNVGGYVNVQATPTAVAIEMISMYLETEYA